MTLLNSSSYLPGALVLAHSLRELHPQPRTVEFHTVCFVTPETVDVESIKQLRSAFDVVIGVEVITSGAEGEASLQLMGELGHRIRTLSFQCSADMSPEMYDV